MSTRSIRRRLDLLTGSPSPLRSVVQRIAPDGTAEPSSEDVEARCAELEAAGSVPRIITLRIVNSMPPEARA
jgi:hypothetical protein